MLCAPYPYATSWSVGSTPALLRTGYFCTLSRKKASVSPRTAARRAVADNDLGLRGAVPGVQVDTIGSVFELEHQARVVQCLSFDPVRHGEAVSTGGSIHPGLLELSHEVGARRSDETRRAGEAQGIRASFSVHDANGPGGQHAIQDAPSGADIGNRWTGGLEEVAQKRLFTCAVVG
eukprot:1614485-Rhodomonas_salina.2